MRVAPRHGRRTGAALPGPRLVLLALLFASQAPAATPAAPPPETGPRPTQTSIAEPSTARPPSARPPSTRPSSTRPNLPRAAQNQARREKRAAPLADYRVRAGGAAARLEASAAHYERLDSPGAEEGGDGAESAAGPEEDFEAASVGVRDLLPARERVESAGGFIEVDNAWLHAALAEAEGAEDERQRAAVLRAAAGRLRSLEARLAEAEAAPAVATDRDAERGRLNAILRGPEFDRDARVQQQGGALRRLIDQVLGWFNDLIRQLLGLFGPLQPGATSPVTSGLARILVLVLCLAVLAYVARRLWLRRGSKVRSLRLRRGARVVLGERLEADQTASDLLDDAERLARSGDLRGAIRKAYVALLCELGDRGVVRLARHKTNRDYLDAVRRAARPGLYTEMLPLTFDYEVHWYGLRDASDADWESFKTRCRQLLKLPSR